MIELTKRSRLRETPISIQNNKTKREVKATIFSRVNSGRADTSMIDTSTKRQLMKTFRDKRDNSPNSKYKSEIYRSNFEIDDLNESRMIMKLGVKRYPNSRRFGKRSTKTPIYRSVLLGTPTKSPVRRTSSINNTVHDTSIFDSISYGIYSGIEII